MTKKPNQSKACLTRFDHCRDLFRGELSINQAINQAIKKKKKELKNAFFFGFPSNSDVMQVHVLIFCILYTKYYIYIQRLFNNNTLDLYTCLNQVKQALKIEENICKTNNKKEKFHKYNFIYENI